MEHSSSTPHRTPVIDMQSLVVQDRGVDLPAGISYRDGNIDKFTNVSQLAAHLIEAAFIHGKNEAKREMRDALGLK